MTSLSVNYGVRLSAKYAILNVCKLGDMGTLLYQFLQFYIITVVSNNAVKQLCNIMQPMSIKLSQRKVVIKLYFLKFFLLLFFLISIFVYRQVNVNAPVVKIKMFHYSFIKQIYFTLNYYIY